ncbi:hypothetical protein [Yersinia pestis]|uniref:hypothetical protein n=1 Tax=Yersinia pestis TaxID=632 RepID=UPI0022648671|nr:hypothetical protein [Yersinia pestis]
MTPTHIVSPEAAPTVSGAQMTEMAGGIGDAVGGTAGKRINQAAEVAKTALDAKAKVLDGGVTPLNLAAGGAGAGLPDSAAAALIPPGQTALRPAIYPDDGQFTAPDLCGGGFHPERDALLAVCAQCRAGECRSGGGFCGGIG